MERAVFRKSERLCGDAAIAALFSGKSKGYTIYPVRAVAGCGMAGAEARVLVSVPKRRLKLAVDRNRVKRQLREAYRKNKGLLGPSPGLDLALLWVGGKPCDTAEVEGKVAELLRRVSEGLGL